MTPQRSEETKRKALTNINAQIRPRCQFVQLPQLQVCLQPRTASFRWSVTRKVRVSAALIEWTRRALVESTNVTRRHRTATAGPARSRPSSNGIKVLYVLSVTLQSDRSAVAVSLSSLKVKKKTKDTSSGRDLVVRPRSSWRHLQI